MPEAEEMTGVRVRLSTITYVHQFAEVISDIDRAYNAIYFFFDLVRDAEDAHRYWRRYWPGPDWPAVLPFLALPVRGKRGALIAGSLADIKGDPAEYVHPADRLKLKACRIESPGYLDFLGKLNPLEIIRAWVQDSHERRKDREYREQAEKEKLQLENQILRNQVVRERMEIMRELGVPRTAVKQVVNELLVKPLVPVERHLDSGEVQMIGRIPVQANEKGGAGTE